MIISIASGKGGTGKTLVATRYGPLVHARLGIVQENSGKLGVSRHSGVPALVCINKYDINEENTRYIESRCLEQGIPVAARIPFDNVVTEAMIHGIPLV